jgi:arylsulfatase
MKRKKQMIAAGLTVSMAATLAGCAGIPEEYAGLLNSLPVNPEGNPAPAEPEATEPAGTQETEGDGYYNILFITADQQHYFAEDPEGTNWKARQLLSELGTTFEKHYSCSNMSTSSRSVMFTGTHITDTGMIDNTDFVYQDAMDDSLTTIGDMMREAGYYSALKGKWHLGDASILADTATLTDLDAYGYSDWGGKDYIGSLHEGHEIDPVIVSETLDWLDTKGKELSEEKKPFFLQVNLINPHDIMDYDNMGYESPNMEMGGAPDDPLYETTYDAPIPDSWDFDITTPDVPDAIRIYQEIWSFNSGKITDEEHWQDYQNYYFNCIQDSDNNLMDILDYLQDNGMMDNTVIVFTVDHGEMHGSHSLKGKGGFMYDNNMHVPLVIVHPDYEGGRRISCVTSHVDLAPTLVDLTNIPDEKKEEITKDLPGHSLMPLMDGSADSVRDASLFCYEMLSFTAVEFGTDEEGNVTRDLHLENRGMMRGITTDKYKYVRYFSPLDFNTPTTLEELFEHNDVQLFDLEADPDELVNLAADPEANGELILELNDLLNETVAREIGEDDGAEVLKAINTIKELAEQQ